MDSRTQLRTKGICVLPRTIKILVRKVLNTPIQNVFLFWIAHRQSNRTYIENVIFYAIFSEYWRVPLACSSNHYTASRTLFPKWCDSLVRIWGAVSIITASSIGYHRYFGMLPFKKEYSYLVKKELGTIKYGKKRSGWMLLYLLLQLLECNRYGNHYSVSRT